ncbi:MAG: hypothetical protein HY678_00370 [Chloroflexi bacterium]|nr:hypothetical protein [Chloroflexota bacterium]
MPRRMTIIFDDEDLYRALKVESARKGRYAKDIIAEALREWLESKEEAELEADLDEARREWERSGGVEAKKFFRDLDRR